MIYLDKENRKKVHTANYEVFETGEEPPDWQHRHVMPIQKSSAKDLYELQQQRLISLLSHFGKTYR